MEREVYFGDIKVKARVETNGWSLEAIADEATLTLRATCDSPEACIRVYRILVINIYMLSMIVRNPSLLEITKLLCDMTNDHEICKFTQYQHDDTGITIL